MVGHTNVGKSSIIECMVKRSGLKKSSTRLSSKYGHLSPTVSIFPQTTLGNVEIPLKVFKHPQGLETRAMLYDTPGIEGVNAYFNNFIERDYLKATSLLRVGGFQRPPDSMKSGTSPKVTLSSNIEDKHCYWED